MIKRMTAVTIWLAALWGSLQLGPLAGRYLSDHTICGPWGCGPPTSALLAWNLFWLIFSLGPIGWLIATLAPVRLQRIGSTILVAALCLMIGVGVWDAVSWTAQIPDGRPTYFLQRYLFVLVTWVDLPVLPLTAAGLLLLWAGQRRRKRPQGANSETPVVASRAAGKGNNHGRKLVGR